MKTIIKTLAAITLLVCILLIAKPVKADPPQPPSTGHGQTGNGTPAGAPIDGGLGILLAMGAAYGGKKLYKARKDKNKAEEQVVEN